MADPGTRLRLLTWNIHGCVGGDGRHDVARVRRAVSALAPDVAAFQEVDSRRSRGAGPRPGVGQVYDILREAVGDHGHDAWAISSADGHYGQCLASRFPLTDRQVHDISLPGQEPRKVISARLQLPAAAPRIITTHLGLRHHERRRQLAALEEIVRADLSTPTLLLGDFNGWFWPRWTQRGLFRLFEGRTRQRTFPARLPLLALDRIWCRPGHLLARSWTAEEAGAASDHLPLLAEIDLPGTP